MLRRFGFVHLIIPLSHRVLVQLFFSELVQTIDFKLVQVPCRSANRLRNKMSCKKPTTTKKNHIVLVRMRSRLFALYFFIGPLPRAVGRPDSRYEQMVVQKNIVVVAVNEKRQSKREHCAFRRTTSKKKDLHTRKYNRNRRIGC